MLNDKERYEFNLKCACISLASLEERQGTLINGNFTFHAKRNKVKVKDLKIAYQDYKAGRSATQ